MTVQNYRELVAWQKAMDLVIGIYRATACFPKKETYGLRSQVRSAVNSIPSNIAEGQGRQTTGEFINFLSMAHGSLREVETQVIIAHRLNYITEDVQAGLLNSAAEVGRLINGLINSLKR